MLTDRQEKICDKFRDKCAECPYIINYEDKTCKAIMHWDRNKKRWVYDDDSEENQ